MVHGLWTSLYAKPTAYPIFLAYIEIMHNFHFTLISFLKPVFNPIHATRKRTLLSFSDTRVIDHYERKLQIFDL